MVYYTYANYVSKNHMEGGTQRIESGQDYPRAPEVKKSTEIFFINDFAEYSGIPGTHLNREEFERTKTAAEEPGTRVNETLAINAQTYARKADISLSHESLVLYSVLRKDEDISSDLLLSDQQILAEVLRIEGKADDAKKLIAAYPILKF